MERKIIQIATCAWASYESRNLLNYQGESLYALCNDGTVWWLDADPPPEGKKWEWIELPEIPGRKS